MKNDESAAMVQSVNRDIKVSTWLHKEIQEVNINLVERIKQSRRELEAAKQKAEDVTKSKSEFLANMSHKIRTPMNGIIGMSYLLLQTQLDDKQKNYIQKIDHSAKLLLEVMDDILDSSKNETGSLNVPKVHNDLSDIKKSKKIDTKLKCDPLKEEELFLKLKEALSRKMSRQCMVIFERLDTLKLSDDVANMTNQIKKLVEKRKYNDAIKIMDK